jgi:hypothetical protein
LAVGELWIFLEEDIDDSSEAVVIVCLFAIFVQVNLSFLKMIALKLLHFYFKLFSEKFAVWLGSNSILFNDLP